MSATPQKEHVGDVLIVDDKPENLKVLMKMLNEQGYQVRPAISGELALKACEHSVPGLVLLDINMPGMSGYEVCRKLKANSTTAEVPVIFISALDSTFDKVEAFRCGAIDYVSKPFQIEEVLARVSTQMTLRQLTAQQMRRLALFDETTGLPNRTYFLQTLAERLDVAKRDGRSLAMFFLNLDQFGLVNKTFGYQVADEVLREVTRRLDGCLRSYNSVSDVVGEAEQSGRDAFHEKPGPVLARTGGDEFIALVDDLARERDAIEIAQRFRDEIARAFLVKEREVSLSVSIGISLYPLDADDAQGLVKCADVAMSHAKQEGSDGYAFYSNQINTEAEQQLRLRGELKRALELDQFELHYQPRIDLASGKTVAAEALIRWRHPDRGLVMPGAFIESVEQSGFIVPLGAWVLRSACHAAAQWSRDGAGEVAVSVNVSMKQLNEVDFLAQVRECLSDAGLAPSRLELELTEGMLVRNAERTMKLLNGLRELGVTLSIDDFGTGYSSLSYLKRLPVNTLKIDRSFVKDVELDDDDAMIVSVTIALAKGFGLRTVAEGVETAGQRERLRALGCDEVQGFLYSKPLPLGEFLQRQAEWRDGEVIDVEEPTAKEQPSHALAGVGTSPQHERTLPKDTAS